MIRFFLLVNKQGQPRLMRFYGPPCPGAGNCKTLMNQEVSEVIKTSLSKEDNESNFFDYKSMKIIYRKYATLFFIVATDEEENELAILEFLHQIVETFDNYFENVCEIDIMFNLDRAYMILDELISNGYIEESNKMKALGGVRVIDNIINR